MKNILIFSGTTEGRMCSEMLESKKISHTVSVATEYGEMVMKKSSLVTVLQGRLNKNEMSDVLCERNIQIVIDATHPYAVKVTETIRECVDELVKKNVDIAYLRLERNIDKEEGTLSFDDNEECADALKKISGNILLTTGSKELAVYCKCEELRNRLYVRVLPGMESLDICKKQGLLPKQIIALQGPFSTELNLAFIRQYDIACMVSKAGGRAGGFIEKKEACQKAGIPLYVVQKKDTDGEKIKNENSSIEKSCKENDIDIYDFAGICKKLEELATIKLYNDNGAYLNIILAGTGMGSQKKMTVEVLEAVKNADIIIGASRMIEPYKAKLEKKSAYMPDEITEWLIEKSRQYSVYGKLNVVILFSGDSGFYSGCSNVRKRIKKALEAGRLCGEVRTYPGISSLQSMASACGMNWQSMKIYSIHGRKESQYWKEELRDTIRYNEKTFVLVAGAEDIRTIGSLLLGKDDRYLVYVGYQISYPEEEIRCLTPLECTGIEKKGLYAVIVVNKYIENKIITPGIGDDEFIRGKVPMTKEEIREISICKLGLSKNSIVYDIGSGTGSIAIEIAELSSDIKVYAIEKKILAIELEYQNREKFGLNNIEIVEGEAPDALTELEIPTHAFIGGSGSNLLEILDVLYKKNDKMRVVINVVSIETLAKLQMIPEDFSVRNFEIVQVQTSRYRELGSYHLPKAENPVVICSFEFGGNED